MTDEKSALGGRETPRIDTFQQVGWPPGPLRDIWNDLQDSGLTIGEADTILRHIAPFVRPLIADSEVLRHSNIIEIAVRNDTGSINDYMKHWESRALLAEAEIAQLRQQYNELIFAVETKREGQSRHQTALNYINQAERGNAMQMAAHESLPSSTEPEP